MRFSSESPVCVRLRRSSLLLFAFPTLSRVIRALSSSYPTYIADSIEMQPARGAVSSPVGKNRSRRRLPTTFPVLVASSVSRLRFCQMAIAGSTLLSFFLSLFLSRFLPIYTTYGEGESARNAYSASRIRDILLSGSFDIIYWSPMKSASSRFFSPGESGEAEERLGTYSTWRKFSGGCNTGEIKGKSYTAER